MQDYKASYILTKSEMLFLLSSMPESRPSQPALYAINEYLSDSVPSQETVESLVGKKLARKVAGSISVEPVVDLLVKTVLSAVSLWEIKGTDSEVLSVILRSDILYLLATRYKYIGDNWKVTPYQDHVKLLAVIEDVQINGVKRVDSKGNISRIASMNELIEGGSLT